jgi:hypothetical protein
MKQSQQLVAVLAILSLPWPAHAALQWATWGNPSGNRSTATFVDGQTVELTADFTGISAGEPAGLEFTSAPPIPGRPNNTNPPFTRMITGTPGMNVSAGALVAELNLTGLPAGASVVFGLGDQRDTFVYRLELRDAARAVLPLTGVVVTPYDLTYRGSSLIADLNTILIGNQLIVDQVHTAGGSYRHTGLTTFSNLPPATRYISLYAAQLQESEGIQIHLGADFTATPVATPTPGAIDCVGDCNGDGVVTVDELVRMVNIGLDILSLSNCAVGDGNQNGEITIDEVITGINNGLNGCP